MAEKDDIAAKEECPFKGVPMVDINLGCSPWSFTHLPAIEVMKNHDVLYKLPWVESDAQPPAPLEGKLKWDEHHVKMPCSARNTRSTSVKENVRLSVVFLPF